jgi:hypothetical protein
VQQHIHPGQRVFHPEPPPDLVRDPGQRPALIRMAAGARVDIQDRFQLAQLGRSELAPGPPAPRDASAAQPPAARGRRHRFADIRDTRNRLATS